MVTLCGGKGILVNFSFHFNHALGLTESVVHHMLVVSDQGHLSFELGIEVILSLSVHITLFSHRGGVALLALAESIPLLIILTQAVVEGILAVAGLVHDAHAARVVADVRVTTSSVVRVDYRLGVDMGKVISRPGFRNAKGTYKDKRRYSECLRKGFAT